MYNYRSPLTNKLYFIESRILPYVNPDTGIKDTGYIMVSGLINNKAILLDSPVSYERMAAACLSMLICLEHYLDGWHNITHYNDFPEFQVIK